MSSPEIDQHVNSATRSSRQHKSSSHKPRSSSADNFQRRDRSCVVCRDEWSPQPASAGCVRESLRGTSSPMYSWGRRASASPGRKHFTKIERSSTPSNHPRSLRSPSPTGSHRAPSTIGAGSPGWRSSFGESSSLRTRSPSPNLSPLARKSPSIASTIVGTPPWKRNFSPSTSTILGTPPRRSSRSPTSYHRFPSTSPPLSTVSESHKVPSSSAKSSKASILEKHAHCNEENCALGKEYIEQNSRSFVTGNPFLPQVSGASQACLLGRHEECNCRNIWTPPGEAPLRLQHEAIPHDIAKLEIVAREDGQMILLDRGRRVWYLIALGGLISNPEVTFSGEYNPLPEIPSMPLGCTYPWYDDVYGLRASAQIIENLKMQSKRRSDFPEHTGYTTSKYSLDKPSDIDSKENRLGRARTVLEKKYLASFPWLERGALDSKVKRDCNFLWREYYILGAKLEDDYIINFYEAWEFDDGTELDDRHAIPGRDPRLIDQGVYPQADSKGTSVYPRMVTALMGKYLASFPWLGDRAAESKARYDVFWLTDQALYHYRGRRRSMDDRIIEFYGAYIWDTWISGANDKEDGFEVQRDDDKERGTWPTYRIISALAKRYRELGRDRAIKTAKYELLHRSNWYRGKSDISAMERKAMKYFDLEGYILEG